MRLHEEGLIYRGKRLVNWDPVLHTALSDLEVIAEPEAGHLWHLRYPLADGSGHLVVATTRPETMLGDTAVAVHPDDERYRHLVGRQVRLPLTGRLIPIIADDYVRPGVRHRLRQDHAGARLQRLRDRQAPRAAADQHPDARTRRSTTKCPPPYRGLDRFEARKRVVADLEARRPAREGRAAHAARAARRPQRRGARALAHRPVVRADRAARRARDRRRRGRPHPLRARELVEDLLPVDAQHPGLVHQPPALVGPPHPGLVRRRRQHLRRAHRGRARRPRPRSITAGRVALRQDEDVLDTWFSSALWPFSTLGWPEPDAGTRRRSTRPPCWSPASTSSSSGSPA